VDYKWRKEWGSRDGWRDGWALWVDAVVQTVCSLPDAPTKHLMLKIKCSVKCLDILEVAAQLLGPRCSLAQHHKGAEMLPTTGQKL